MENNKTLGGSSYARKRKWRLFGKFLSPQGRIILNTVVQINYNARVLGEADHE